MFRLKFVVETGEQIKIEANFKYNFDPVSRHLGVTTKPKDIHDIFTLKINFQHLKKI